MSELVSVGRLTLREAQASPCMSCESSPCCTHVPLHTFQVRTLRDLDHAIYLLNFERIVLGLAPNGDWSVYYKYPCRFLDRSEPKRYRCTIHGTPQQPQICVNYSPYACWYRPAFNPGVGDGFLAIDRRRLEAILERVGFDDQRNVIDTPDWPALMAMCAEIPLAPDDFDDAPAGEPVFDGWLSVAATGLVTPPRRKKAYADFVDACTGCSAWCCKTLVFPHARPTGRKGLDYLQFVLGFPGIEVGVSDGSWSIIVRTRCRHLTADNRCGVYGQPERPGLCRYFDATGCSYVAQFGEVRPERFMRIRLEQFFWMVDALAFDADGGLVELPPTDQLREIVEERWRDAVTTAAAELSTEGEAHA